MQKELKIYQEQACSFEEGNKKLQAELLEAQMAKQEAESMIGGLKDQVKKLKAAEKEKMESEADLIARLEEQLAIKEESIE